MCRAKAVPKRKGQTDPMTQDILTRPAVELVSQMAAGQVSAVELMRATLQRIDQRLAALKAQLQQAD